MARGWLQPSPRPRTCARPGCARPAEATLTFRYASQEASIALLAPVVAPEAYDLCVDHAGRTRPPFGWTLRDERPGGPPVGAGAAAGADPAATAW